MYYTFMAAAIIGGSVFVLQFLMALVGMGGDELDFDVADEIPDDVDPTIDHGSTWLFGVISFRTVVAAVTFFGLAGMASVQSNLGGALAVIIALASGSCAMFGVHWLMQTLYGLRQDGSARIQRSVGKIATVYIPIPPNLSGSGKIQIRMQGRIMEYPAMTSETEKLSTGARVVVVDVISPTTLQVEPIREAVGSP